MAGNDYVRLAAACCGKFKFVALSRRTPRGPFTCGNCGVSYTTSRPNGEGERFCSRACCFSDKAAKAAARARQCKGESKAQSKRCSDCGSDMHGKAQRCDACTKSFEVRRSMAAYRRRPQVVRTCPYCLVQWCAIVRVGVRQHCFDKSCSAHHRAAVASSRRGSKSHERRAKRFGVERRYFPARTVLERDGWRCKLCGVKTPEKLRGTLDPRAPELDHIVPLSQGGPHTKQNTQCACRRCNSLKGAKAAGQTLLFG